MGANKRRKRMASFVALPRGMLRSPEWRVGLSSSAKVVYVHLKHKFDGHNNGEISLHYSELEDLMAAGTICRAFKELVENGWIERDHTVGGKYRFTIYYKLTGRYDESISRFSF